MSAFEVTIGLVMLVGLVGVVVPVFPGLILVAGATFVWALERGGTVAWVTCALVVAVGTAGVVASGVLPARRASAAGAPGWVIVAGAVGMVIGFFVVPVVGALVGFPAGVLVAELWRHRRLGPAWRATWDALKGVGAGIAIQLGAGVVMIGIWAAAVAST
jgi:hypothetical protein